VSSAPRADFSARAGGLQDHSVLKSFKELGFTKGRVPSVGTLFTVFSRVDKAALETALNGWAESVLAVLPEEASALAGDGKVLRGSLGQGASETTLLSIVSHVSQRLGLTVLQHAVPDTTNEIGAMPDVLRALILEGCVLTLDAAHTQKVTAKTIVEKGAITS
jgi:hypothetical protein